jgi:hypothetical protein
MLRTVNVALILAAGVGLAHSGLAHADADIYRWKDAQGIYHYSDQWVPGSELIKSSGRQHPPVEAPRSSDSDAPPASSSSSLPPDPPASAATVQAVKQDLAKVREQQCKDAKDAYDKAIHARRITRESKGGQKEYLSDAEADAYRIRVRDDMDHFCGSSSATTQQ